MNISTVVSQYTLPYCHLVSIRDLRYYEPNVGRQISWLTNALWNSQIISSQLKQAWCRGASAFQRLRTLSYTIWLRDTTRIHLASDPIPQLLYGGYMYTETHPIPCDLYLATIASQALPQTEADTDLTSNYQTFWWRVAKHALWYYTGDCSLNFQSLEPGIRRHYYITISFSRQSRASVDTSVFQRRCHTCFREN